MSEFGQQFRVFGETEDGLLSSLGRLDRWSLGETEGPDGERITALTSPGAASELSDGVWFTHEAEHNYTTMHLWNLEAHEDIVEELNRSGLTYLVYLYHTGAGFDELSVFVDGEHRLTEDLGELYEFRIDDECVDLDYDWDRDDDWGRSFLNPVPLRGAALKLLTNEMGESAAILNGWEQCVDEELPLYYLPGLD